MQKFLAFLIIGSLSFCSTLLKINDFNGGIDSSTSPEKIKANQFTDITNMNFGIAGSLQKRNGVTLNNQFLSLNITYTNTANGFIHSVEVGTPDPTVPPRSYDSVTNNGSPYVYGNTGVSPPWFVFPIISFKDVIIALKGSHVRSAIWTGSAGGSNQYSKLYFVSQNIDILTISYNGLNQSSIDTTISASATVVSGRFSWDLTAIINLMVDSGYYTVSTGTRNTLGATGSLPIDYGFAYGSYLTIQQRTLINIDERDENVGTGIAEPDELFIFNDRLLYNGITATASVQRYTNTQKNSYLFGATGQNYSWNSYIKNFTGIGYTAPANIAYSSVPISGNLDGTYNYAVTYKYDNQYESNPALSQFQSSATQNYTFGVAYIRLGGFNYAFQEIAGSLYVTKTTLGNIFIASTLIASNQTFFKAMTTSQNIFFSTNEGFIYKLNPVLLNIDTYYANVNIVNGYTWRSPQFSIVGGQIKVFNYFESRENVSGIFDYYFHYSILDLNLHSIDSISSFYDTSFWSGKTKSAKDFICLDINSSGYVYSYWWDYGTNRSYYINPITYTWTGSHWVTGFASDLTQEGLVKVKGMDNSYNGFYNNNFGLINVSTPNYILTTSTNFIISSSDILAGFDSSGTLVSSTSTSLNVMSSVSNSYLTSINFMLNNGQMLVTIPTSNSGRVTARNIYRNKGSSGYYLLSTIADNITTTYNDNISDTQQSVIALNYDNDIPPIAIDACYNVARLFYLDSNGTIWYSKVNNPEAVPLLNYININAGVDDSPKRIIPFFSGLVVFFSKSIWYIDLSNQSTLTWVPRKLNIDYGCDYPNSITIGKLPDQSIGIFYFASDKSIRVLNGSGKNSIQIFDNIYTDSLSLPIQYDLETVTDNVNEIYGAYYKYSYYLSIPNQNKVYLYDTQVRGLTKYKYPTKYKYMGVVDSMLFAGDYTSSSLYKLEDSSSLTDIGTPISWNVKTKIFADDYEINKDYSTMWLRGKQTATGNVFVKLSNNTDAWTKEQTVTMNLMTTRNATIVTQKKKILNSYGRDIQIEVSGTPNLRIDDITLEIIPRSD